VSVAADLATTRRRRMLAFLVEQGGVAGLAEANAFSESKLLAAHQAFSAIMEGLVDGGWATWDGERFSVTQAGRDEAALAPRGRRAASSSAVASPDAPPPEASPALEVPPPPAAASTVEEVPVEAPPPVRPPPVRPAPEVDPPRRGLRVRLLGLLRRLVARGR
jgi:hypothetical protein